MCKNNKKLIYLTFIHCIYKFEKHKQSCLSENYKQTFPSENYKRNFHNKSVKSLKKIFVVASVFVVAS